MLFIVIDTFCLLFFGEFSTDLALFGVKFGEANGEGS